MTYVVRFSALVSMLPLIRSHERILQGGQGINMMIRGAFHTCHVVSTSHGIARGQSGEAVFDAFFDKYPDGHEFPEGGIVGLYDGPSLKVGEARVTKVIARDGV
jgi:hypothetical protein